MLNQLQKELERRGSRWWSRKFLSSPIPTDILKLQLPLEQLFLRMTRRLAEQIFLHLRNREKATLRMVAGSSQDPHTLCGVPQVGEISWPWRFPHPHHRSDASEPHIEFPSAGEAVPEEEFT